MERKRKYSPEYYQKHRDRLLETSKKWQHENRDSRRKYENKCYRENPEKKLKICKNYRNRHKEAINAKRRKDRANNRSSEYAWKKMGIYLTMEEYWNILYRQGGLCAICRKTDNKRKLAVDHNHETGEIRGLLCQKCNAALGFLGDNALILESALRYINGEV